MELPQKSLRGMHFEAAATRFESARRIWEDSQVQTTFPGNGQKDSPRATAERCRALPSAVERCRALSNQLFCAERFPERGPGKKGNLSTLKPLLWLEENERFRVRAPLQRGGRRAEIQKCGFPLVLWRFSAGSGSETGELETGDRRLEIGFAQRFLLHSDSFASISTRLQKRFWILTNQALRLAFAMDVHFSKGSLGFPKVHRRASGIDKVQTS